MIIVTGGAGFIGSHIVRGLNARGITDILVVDNLKNSAKFTNLCGCQMADYMDKSEFRQWLEAGRSLPATQAIFHQGACSDTMEYDGRYMMENNFTFSKVLLHEALRNSVPFVYASSGAVYGNSPAFAELPENERPLNVYGFSKLVFDQYVRRLLPEARSSIAGLRYFNGYGPGEGHKGRMASMVSQCLQQLKATGVIRLFAGSHGYTDGEQCRDFVFVEDLVTVNLFFAGMGPHPPVPRASGVFNVGTGQSRSFNAVARALIAQHGSGAIEYVPFPESLRDRYQARTEADIRRLRAAGYGEPFTPLEEGVANLYAAERA